MKYVYKKLNYIENVTNVLNKFEIDLTFTNQDEKI